MNNTELIKLKQDIINTRNIVKKNQFDLKEKIDDGWLDNVDAVLENNPNYFQEQLQKLYPPPEEPKKEILIKKENWFQKLFRKLKSFM